MGPSAAGRQPSEAVSRQRATAVSPRALGRGGTARTLRRVGRCVAGARRARARCAHCVGPTRAPRTAYPRSLRPTRPAGRPHRPSPATGCPPTAATEPGRGRTILRDKTDGPTAGTQALDPLEFLARFLTHIPDPGQVMTRYYGWYASRTRGMRRRQAAGGAEIDEPVAIADPVDWSLRAACCRWAELLRRICEVDPLARPRCSALMRIVAVITDPPVVNRILAHRARALERARQSRSPPSGRPRPATRVVAGPMR